MKISQRGHDIQASPIRKLKRYADAAKAKGVKVFHLNIGDPDIPAPQPVVDTFHGWSEPVLGYGPAQGFLELREAITRYFESYGIPLGPDEVLITTGGSEAIHFTFSVIGDVGDEPSANGVSGSARCTRDVCGADAAGWATPGIWTGCSSRFKAASNTCGAPSTRTET